MLEYRKDAKGLILLYKFKAPENQRFSASICLIFTEYNFIGDKSLRLISDLINKNFLRLCVFLTSNYFKNNNQKNRVNISIFINNNYNGNGYFEYPQGLIFLTLEVT